MIILNYILIYLSIILGSIIFSIRYNKKIEHCIIIDIFCKMVVLYIFGLLQQLKLGVYIVLYLPIIIGTILLLKNRKKENLKNLILTPGLIFFSIIYFILVIATFDRVSDCWDEYSFWSLASKNMYHHDSLLVFADVQENIPYPPIPTIWQYFFTRTLNTYNQGIEILANQILGFALLLPIFDKTTKTLSKIPKICMGIIILCIPCIFEYLIFYEAIYIDAIIGILIGYIFLQLYNEKDKKFLYMSLCLAFILLSYMKSTGFYLALILIGVIALQKIIEIYKIKKSSKQKLLEIIKKQKEYIIFIVVLICIIVILFLIWTYLVNRVDWQENELKFENTENHRTISQAISSIFTTIFRSTDENYYLDISNRQLVEHLYTAKVFDIQIYISAITHFFITILGGILIYKKIIPKEEKNRFLYTFISIKVGFIIYILFLQLAYLTQFETNEMLTHASLNRYINTYFLAEFIWLLCIILDYCNKGNQKLRYIVLTIVILAITPIYMITNNFIFFGSYNAKMKDKNFVIEKETLDLKQRMDEDSKIYVVHQKSDENSKLYKMKYYMLPEINITITEKISEVLDSQYKEIGKNLKEEWINILISNYDYLYIIDSDEYFNNFAKDVFSSEIKNHTLYKINKSENNTIQIVEEEERVI